MRGRAVFASYMYKEGTMDSKITAEREIGMWWNEVVRPERPRAVQRRALLVRQCEVECNRQVKDSSKKRKRDGSRDEVVVGYSDEIVID